MNTALNNVLSIEKNYVTKYVESFLTTKKNESANTYISYKKDLEDFFMFMFKKEYKFVEVEEVVAIQMVEMNDYFNYLSNNFANSTIRRKMTGVRSFFNFLEATFKDVNVAMFKVIKLPSTDEDIDSYDALDYTEIQQMLKMCKDKFNTTEKIEWNQMYCLIKLGFITAIRLEALLSLEWDKHFYKTTENKLEINFIQVTDKSQNHKKSISEEFYNELKNELGHLNPLFTDLHKHKVGRLLKELFEEMNVDKRRNLKFHSIKKASIKYIYETTNDVKKMQIQANHKSPATTLKYYVKFSEKLIDMPSFTMGVDIEGKVDEMLEELSHKQLIELIKKSSLSSKIDLLTIKHSLIQY